MSIEAREYFAWFMKTVGNNQSAAATASKTSGRSGGLCTLKKISFPFENRAFLMFIYGCLEKNVVILTLTVDPRVRVVQLYTGQVSAPPVL